MTLVTLDEVVQLVGEVLQLGSTLEGFTEHTQLLGSIPEFDSMAVVSVVTAIEENYGIIIDDDEISAEVFETLGTLHNFVREKAGG